MAKDTGLINFFEAGPQCHSPTGNPAIDEIKKEKLKNNNQNKGTCGILYRCIYIKQIHIYIYLINNSLSFEYII